MTKIITLTNPDIFASNCYIIISDNAVSVVDPSVEYSVALEKLPQISNLKAKYVLLTHAHIDHMWEIYSYVAQGFKVCVSSSDASKLDDKNLNCAFALRGKIDSYRGEYMCVADGERINLDDKLSVYAMFTPGHTDGSVCYISDDFAFTGDTLFANGGFGRYDLPTGNAILLASSLRRLLNMPADLTIYPGHGEKTTIKETKVFFDISERES